MGGHAHGRTILPAAKVREDVKLGRDDRESGKYYACCCICGRGMAYGTTSWWCRDCRAEFGLTTYASANIPKMQWVRYLVREERKRRHAVGRDAAMLSLDALEETENGED